LQHTHLCNRDRYAISLEIESPDRFQTYYTINGPIKQNIINTLYSRSPIQNTNL
jgi:hypothetical protein